MQSSLYDKYLSKVVRPSKAQFSEFLEGSWRLHYGRSLKWILLHPLRIFEDAEWSLMGHAMDGCWMYTATLSLERALLTSLWEILGCRCMDSNLSSPHRALLREDPRVGCLLIWLCSESRWIHSWSLMSKVCSGLSWAWFESTPSTGYLGKVWWT